MKVHIILTNAEYNDLRRQLFPTGDSREHFGFGLAGSNRYQGGCDLLLRKFILADRSCLSGQSGAGVRPDPRFVDYVWTLARKSNSSLVDFHTHPFCDRHVRFSGIDDRSEYESFPKAVEYLGDGPHASIVLGRNSLDARWYNSQTHTLEPIASFKILGDKLVTIAPTSSLRDGKPETPASDMFDRQIRVFGKEGQNALQKLTVGIAGVGGIGSVVFFLLLRLGVGRLVVVDNDHVEKSNLNRLAGSSAKDAKDKTPKVLMLLRCAEKINPKVHVTGVRASILEERAQRYLKLCDVFFGCTDNESSRWMLNKFSVEHLIPYFDTGTGIQADAEQHIEHAGGQVRVVIPGMGCLSCINGIAVDIAQQELLPEADRRIAIERGYIAGADVPAPAVGFLNGVIANLAVTEFMAFVTGFKPLQRYLFYNLIDARVTPCEFVRDPHCFTCSPTAARGIGDKGRPLPADMLIDESKPQKQVKGDSDMETEKTSPTLSLAELLATAQQKGLDIEGDARARWFLIKNAKLSRQFNKTKTHIMVKFIEDGEDPVVLVPENLEVRSPSAVCASFVGRIPYIKGWKALCPHMFQDIGDEMLEFVACLIGFLAKPQLCGLMGCEGSALAQTGK